MNGNTRFRACRRLATAVALLSIWFGATAPLSYGSASWPNEPAGATVITDWGWSDLNGGGWHDEGGDASIVSDSTAPLSPASVLQQRFASGFPGGISPSNEWYTFSPSREIYLGFWWKANAQWEAHPSGINKILFVSREDGGNAFFLIMSGQNPYNLAFSYQEGPWICNGDLVGYPGICGTILVQGGAALIPGNWYRIELYMKMSTTTTSKDGIIKWWANGVQAGNLTTVNFAQSPFAGVPIVPIWGGMGASKTRTDYFWYDHIHISIPGGGTTSDQPPGPPAAPSIKTVTTP